MALLHVVRYGASRRIGQRPRHPRGQALAEFAIVLPIMMLVIGGIIQFGIIFWGQNTLNQVARDTGRWAASQQACSTSSATNAVIATANQVAAQSALVGYTPGSWSSANVTVTWSGSPCPPNSNQQTAWITISINHQVPVFFPWIPGNGNISTTTEFRVEPVPQ